MSNHSNNPKLRGAGRMAWDIFLWVIGTLLYAVAVVVFVRPLQISSGGLTGLGIIVNHLFPFIPIGTFTLVMNVPLFIAAWRAFGLKFIARTMAATALLSVQIDVLDRLADKFGWVYTGNDTLMGAIFGGVIAGIGLGVVFLAGATTGGFDIAGRLLKLAFPHIAVGKLILMCDATVVILTAVMYKSFESLLYSVVTVFLISVALDYVIKERDHSKMMLILTSHPDEVTNDIMRQLARGVSLIHAEGGYTHEEKKMLMCVVRTHEVPQIRKLIAQYDEKPFIIIADSSEVLGEGFKSHKDTL